MKNLIKAFDSISKKNYSVIEEMKDLSMFEKLCIITLFIDSSLDVGDYKKTLKESYTDELVMLKNCNYTLSFLDGVALKDIVEKINSTNSLKKLKHTIVNFETDEYISICNIYNNLIMPNISLTYYIKSSILCAYLSNNEKLKNSTLDFFGMGAVKEFKRLDIVV